MEQVVTLTDLGDGIILVKMEDRASHNTFSAELVTGLLHAFKYIKENTKYKVVIITGYDNYFCCGGGKDELFKIFNKELKFNDLDFFSILLECEIPVISAMQGHGVGGGFVFGLYADFFVLGKENIYTTNFMKYGFTPGMGGTLIVPNRLGNVIANEMLYTARNFRGEELRERGAPFKIVPKAEVLDEAHKLAKMLADKPRLSLITLKNHMAAELRGKINQVVEQELRMHDITFHQPEVAERIESFFGM